MIRASCRKPAPAATGPQGPAPTLPIRIVELRKKAFARSARCEKLPKPHCIGEDSRHTTQPTGTHPVDEILPALGLQHVLVMYAGAIAVPLIVGRALQLPPEDVAFLISVDLFVCGVVSILQSLGAGP